MKERIYIFGSWSLSIEHVGYWPHLLLQQSGVSISIWSWVCCDGTVCGDGTGVCSWSICSWSICQTTVVSTVVTWGIQTSGVCWGNNSYCWDWNCQKGEKSNCNLNNYQITKKLINKIKTKNKIKLTKNSYQEFHFQSFVFTF